jgi:glycogen synthase
VRVLFVGRLEKRKGIDVLLDRIAPLCDAHPDLRFTMVGNDRIPSEDGGTYRERFERSDVGRRLGGRVNFTGPVDDAELRQHYADCDIFVAPSRFESFGLILVEAMMFGRPVIGCDVGGMREIVADGENGYLVPPGDAPALQAAIERLAISADLRRAFGIRSRELYEQRFSRDRMVEDAHKYYRAVAER